MRAVILLAILATAVAQTRQFEVASVKVSPPADPRKPMRIWSRGGPGTDDPGLYTCENCGLAQVVRDAFDLQMYEFPGPEWTENVHLNISAKIPEGTSKVEFREMLQNLLKDRFNLTFHREPREIQGFELVVAKNGPKFKEHVDLPAAQEKGPVDLLKIDDDGYPILPGRKPMMTTRGRFSTERFADQTMAQIAATLSYRFHGPVMDGTGLKGKYDFTLRWVSDGGMPSAGPPGPTIAQAIQEQLGLKAQPKKVAVNMFIIDHIEKTPTEN